MTFSPTAVTGDFDDGTYDFIKGYEESGNEPKNFHLDGTTDIPQVGIAVALITESGGTFSVRSSTELSDIFGSNHTFTSGELTTLGTIATYLNDDDFADAEATFSYAKNTLLQFADLASTAAVRSVYDGALVNILSHEESRTTSVDGSTIGVIFSTFETDFAGSKELRAVEDMVYNDPGLFGAGLADAIHIGDRAKAWYEMLYDQQDWNSSLMTRREGEASLFALTAPDATLSETVDALRTLMNGTDYNSHSIWDIIQARDTYDAGAHFETAAAPQITVVENAYAPGASIDTLWIAANDSTILDFSSATTNLLLIGGNAISGGSGSDWIVGGGGDNTIDGGGGTNTATYAENPGPDGVTVNLTLGTAVTAYGTDTLTHIQNVMGSAYNDIITGDSYNNVVYGSLGSDTINGGGGSNTLDYSALNSPANVAAASGELHIAVTVTSTSTSVAKDHDTTVVGTDSLSLISKIVGTDQNDLFTLYAPTGLTIDGGGGANTVDYSGDSSGITFARSGSTIDATGSGHTDALTSVQHIIATNGTNIFDLGEPSHLTIDGNSSDVINYSNATYDQVTGNYYGPDDETYDTLNYFSSANIHGVTGYRPNFAANETLSSGYLKYDYADATSGATFAIQTNSSLTASGSDPYLSAYTLDITQYVSVAVGGHTQAGDVLTPEYSAFGLYNVISDERLSTPETYVGTNYGDTVTITADSDHIAPVTFITGTGTDDITLDSSSRAGLSATSIVYNGGDKVIHNAGGLTELDFKAGIASGDITVGSYSGGNLVLDVAGTGNGTITLDNYSNNMRAVLLGGGTLNLNSLLPSTTDGYGLAGGTHPEYDSSGNVISQRVSSSLAQNWATSSIATEIMHPFVITSFSTSGSGSGSSTTINYQTYVESLLMASSLTPGDVHLSASTNAGNASLILTLNSGASFTVPYFESGDTIYGFGFYNTTMHEAIANSGTTVLTASGSGSYSGSYTGGDFSGVSLTAMEVVYQLENLFFANGSSIDLQGNLTLTGKPTGSDTIYGFESRINTFVGEGGTDTFYGGPHNDTFIAGTGVEYMHGGSGNNTFTFGPGFNNDTVYANTGSNTIHITGINPSNIRLWTDTYGTLSIQDTTSPSHTITVNAGVTGSNNSESTIGAYISSITFDSSYSTTWDLTAGLTLTGSSSGETLYGTAYGDTISGMAGADNIYGNAGNDTLIGGTGNDNLYGGPGNDTYTFASGWGSDTIHESLSSGTDTIHFSGIAPTDIRMYTDAYGSLYLVDTATGDTITVDGGVTGSNNSESTIGSYVESVTFDSSYSTTWDLTGGLTITGSSSAETLYGTAYNDTISGMSGADNIYGNAGNDTLIGGTGNDNLYGGPGNDTYTFASGWGSDTIHESLSSGTDAIHFSGIAPSDIRMYTDAYGSLYLVDTATGDTITVDGGVSGSNNSESTIGSYVESVTFDSSYSTTWDLTGGLTLTGSSSSETLYGTAYGDTISGMAGSDNIYGNAGNDTLIGGTGNDNLYGGPGNDTYTFASGWGSDGIHESLSSGTDAIHFSGIAPTDIRMYTDAYGSLYLADTAGDTITVDAGVTGSNNSESTIGSYVESVTFDSSYSTTWDLTGGLTLTGSSSADTLYGTAYDDTISGMGGSDNIYGNAGNDTLIGGTGNDNLYGGPGNDTYTFASGWGSDGIHESLSSGTDAIHFSGIAPTDIRMYTDAYGSLYLVDTATGDTITVDGGVTGSNNSESTIGSYVESVAFDSSYSTTWDLTGGLTLTGSSSGETLYGTAHNDVIYGMAGADNIYGNAGDDTIVGGTGNDNLYGGPGNDTYTFASGWGSDGIHESLSSGTDAIHFSGIAPTDIRMYTDAYGSLYLVDTSTGDTITVDGGVTGSNNSESTIGSYVESVTFDSSYSTTWDLTGGLTITGTSSSESLYGTAHDDTINGMGGADNIYGNAGNDTINGGSAAENLYGGPGDDILYGSGGADYLTGGTGADTFLFKAATALGAAVTIADFTTSQDDKIDIADVLTGHYDPMTDAIANFVSLTTSGSDTLLKVDLDGTGTTYSPTTIATISGVTGLDVATLITDHHLIVPT